LSGHLLQATLLLANGSQQVRNPLASSDLERSPGSFADLVQLVLEGVNLALQDELDVHSGVTNTRPLGSKIAF